MNNLSPLSHARNVFFSLCLMILVLSNATAQESEQLGTNRADAQPIRKVFLNITGDQKYAHRLWTFLEFELEDSHVSLMNTEVDADAVVNGEVSVVLDKQNLGLGLLHIRSTFNGKTQDLDSCASLSTNETNGLFDGAASSVGESIRKKYSSAVTVRLDPASDMTQSKRFKTEMVQSLQDSDFKIVETLSSDITLRIDLVPERVPIEERTVKYKITITRKDGSSLHGANGTGVLSAVLAGRPPAVCPERVVDLDWLANANSLNSVARTIARVIREQNARNLNSKQSIQR